MDQPRKGPGQPQPPGGKPQPPVGRPQQAAGKPPQATGKPQPVPGKPQPSAPKVPSSAAKPQQPPGASRQPPAKPKPPAGQPEAFITVPVELTQEPEEERSPWKRPPVLIGLGLLGLLLVIVIGRWIFGGSQPTGLTRVRGTVSYEGAPMAGAVVTFEPVAKQAGSAVATTDAKGRFDMKTVGVGSGVAPGDYKVTVTKFESDQPVTDPDEAKKIIIREGKSPTRGKAINLLPAKYAGRATTPLNVTVETRAGKPLRFDVTKADN